VLRAACGLLAIGSALNKKGAPLLVRLSYFIA